MSSESIEHRNEEATVPSPSFLSNEQTCHILPCNIDYQGMSPSHFFFRPVESSDGCYSSTLRGRGLTALKEEEKNKSNIALLSCQSESLSVKASIESILEWHHEHDPETIQSDDGCKSRVSVAQGWLEVSHAVSRRSSQSFCTIIISPSEYSNTNFYFRHQLHDPIPIEN